MPFINDLLADQNPPSSVSPSAGKAGEYRVGQTRFRFDVTKAKALLRERIVGQPEAMAALDSALDVLKADIADPDRPLWSALLAGPTGVGKTATVKVLAEALTGSADNFCRIDMNTLSQAHYSAALSGAPPGYVGSKEGHTLFDPVLIAGDYSTPGIVLFDEVEKASPEVLRALLNVLEDGHLRLSAGEKTIDFRNTLLLMTSNLGGRDLSAWLKRAHWWPGNSSSVLPPRVKRRVNERIEAFFDPEFINRLDRVLIYRPLGQDNANTLLDLEIARLNRRLNRKGWSLTLTVEVCDTIAKTSMDKRYGARSVRRVVRDAIESPLAQFLLTSGPVTNPGLSVKPTSSTTSMLRVAHGQLQSGNIVFHEQ
ncbi:AAA family ATPase [Gilvimarinus polysaccharolyticus]|uniref:AAA family ATPase n=1 Tax=Gilvimarinus polysaccharolyticus TaxID=863921 RepID=UPI0006732C46|nr:AAA family ATPase [Gilvimarinus polysaccharolyticus]